MAGKLHAIDQDHWNVIAVPPPQIWILIDVHDGDLAAQPLRRSPHNPQRRIAQMAAGPREKLDLRFGHTDCDRDGGKTPAGNCYRKSTSLRLKILPVGPRGRSARMTTRRGTL